MTSIISIAVAESGGVDLRYMFPALFPSQVYNASYPVGGASGSIAYTIGKQKYLLDAGGSSFGAPAELSADVAGIATVMAFSRVDEGGVTRLADLTVSFDGALAAKPGLIINSMTSLTPNALWNLTAPFGDVGFEIKGNTGNDRLIGSSFVDRINGGEGRDMLSGYDGDDLFIFDAFGKGHRDLVTDFDHGDDTIFLDAAVFKGVRESNLEKTFNDITGEGFKAEDANDRLLYDRQSGKLFYDADGNAANGDKPELIAIFENRARIDASDFEIGG